MSVKFWGLALRSTTRLRRLNSAQNSKLAPKSRMRSATASSSEIGLLTITLQFLKRLFTTRILRIPPKFLILN